MVFGKKKNKMKLDDAAKGALMTTALNQEVGKSGGIAKDEAGVGGAALAMSGAQMLNKAMESYQKKMYRVLKAGIGLTIIAVIFIIVGSILVHYLKKYVTSEHWQRVPGIAGIVLIVFGFLVIVIGILIIVWAYYLFKNRERESAERARLTAPAVGDLPSEAYPRQALPGNYIPFSDKDKVKTENELSPDKVDVTVDPGTKTDNTNKKTEVKT